MPAETVSYIGEIERKEIVCVCVCLWKNNIQTKNEIIKQSVSCSSVNLITLEYFFFFGFLYIFMSVKISACIFLVGFYLNILL